MIFCKLCVVCDYFIKSITIVFFIRYDLCTVIVNTILRDTQVIVADSRTS